MVFSSTVFLCAFLPVFLWLYTLAPRVLKNPLLLIASVCFYAWGAPVFLFVVVGMTAVTYWLVAVMNNAHSPLVRRCLMATAVGLNLGLLVYFKYLNFFVENINTVFSFVSPGIRLFELSKVVLPIGISFYTFETVTYIVDVYRGVHPPLKKYFHYQLYILMFPKLIAGPIVRFHEIADQFFNRFGCESADDRLVGLHRFCLGLGKKVLIANAMAGFVDGVYGDSITGAGGIDPSTVDMKTAWFAAIAYAFQIYFDFSGYSDMAIGLGRFMGFRLPENFDCPYISASVTEFWRRWHITLGAWMRNYLYIPLGGNRVSPARTYLNLWIVFALSGLWHGASWNFILWGAWHGLFLICERHWNLHEGGIVGRYVRIAWTFIVVVLGWVFFRVEHFENATLFVKAMLGLGNGTQSFMFPVESLGGLIAAVFFSFVCVGTFGERLKNWVYEGAVQTFTGRLFMTASSILLFTFSLAHLAAVEFNPFIYFRF